MIKLPESAPTAQAFSESIERKTTPRVNVPRLEEMTSFKLSKLVTSIPLAGIKRAVLRALADHYPNVWPSVATLAQEAGFGTTATRKYLRELEADGFIRSVGSRKGGRS